MNDEVVDSALNNTTPDDIENRLVMCIINDFHSGKDVARAGAIR